jgi:hypothetical protein
MPPAVGLFHNLPFVAEPPSATQSSAMAKEEAEAEASATPDVLQLFSADKYNYVGRVRSPPGSWALPGPLAQQQLALQQPG